MHSSRPSFTAMKWQTRLMKGFAWVQLILGAVVCLVSIGFHVADLTSLAPVGLRAALSVLVGSVFAFIWLVAGAEAIQLMVNMAYDLRRVADASEAKNPASALGN